MKDHCNISFSCYKFVSFRPDLALCPHCIGPNPARIHVLLLQPATTSEGNSFNFPEKLSVFWLCAEKVGNYFICCT